MDEAVAFGYEADWRRIELRVVKPGILQKQPTVGYLIHDVDNWRGHERCRKLMEPERERGFVSAFNFVAKRYEVSPELRGHLTENGFGVGVHDLYHDGKQLLSRKIFSERAVEINRYLKE